MGQAGAPTAWYGTAQMPTALEFFLTSRDGPQLSTELAKHQDNLNQLLEQQQQSRNTNPYLQQFGETLQFFQTQLTKAEQGNVLASKLLESLKPINALKEQWKLVQQHQSTVELSDEETPVVQVQAPTVEAASIVAKELKHVEHSQPVTDDKHAGQGKRCWTPTPCVFLPILVGNSQRRSRL